MNIFKECNFDKGEGHLLSTTNDSLNSSFMVIKLVRSFSTFQHLVHASLKKKKNIENLVHGYIIVGSQINHHVTLSTVIGS